jgi:hypothetical protein
LVFLELWGFPSKVVKVFRVLHRRLDLFTAALERKKQLRLGRRLSSCPHLQAGIPDRNFTFAFRNNT